MIRGLNRQIRAVPETRAILKKVPSLKLAPDWLCTTYSVQYSPHRPLRMAQVMINRRLLR